MLYLLGVSSHAAKLRSKVELDLRSGAPTTGPAANRGTADPAKSLTGGSSAGRMQMCPPAFRAGALRPDAGLGAAEVEYTTQLLSSCTPGRAASTAAARSSAAARLGRSCCMHGSCAYALPEELRSNSCCGLLLAPFKGICAVSCCGPFPAKEGGEGS